MVQHALNLRLLRQKRRHGRITPCQVTQRRVVVGVGQHADIEHKIGIHGYATLEGKRFKNQCQALMRLADHVLDLAEQTCGLEQRGVNDQCLFFQHGQQFAFKLNGFKQGMPVLVVGGQRRKRVRTTRFRKPADQRVIRCIQKHASQHQASLGQFLEQSR